MIKVLLVRKMLVDCLFDVIVPKKMEVLNSDLHCECVIMQLLHLAEDFNMMLHCLNT